MLLLDEATSALDAESEHVVQVGGGVQCPQRDGFFHESSCLTWPAAPGLLRLPLPCFLLRVMCQLCTLWHGAGGA